MSRPSKSTKIKKKLSIFWQKNTFLSNTYWFGKLLKSLMKKGRKEFIVNSFVSGSSSLKNITVFPIFCFLEAIEKAKPLMRLMLYRKAKDYYNLPIDAHRVARYQIGVRWISTAISRGDLRSFGSKVANEIHDLVTNESNQVLTRKFLLYGIGVENRAYTHYRWEPEEE